MASPAISRENRRRWQEICDQASAGPWISVPLTTYPPCGGGLAIQRPWVKDRQTFAEILRHGVGYFDAELIAAARTALPALLHELDRIDLLLPADFRPELGTVERVEAYLDRLKRMVNSHTVVSEDPLINDPPKPLRHGLTEEEQREYEELDQLLERTAEQNERWLALLGKSKKFFG